MKLASLTNPSHKLGQLTWACLLLLSLFLLVFGARLWLVQTYTTPLPFWDQWDAEGVALIKPWLEGHLTFASFFAPHNEHRLVLTRLTALALFVLNGQWDAQLEMAFNALLCATIAVIIVTALWRIFPARQHLPILVVVGLLFSLPFSWENTLAGFQSQFYFLLIFSLVVLWGLCVSAPFSIGWRAGICSLCLACLSMSSGFLVAAAVIGLYLLRFLIYRRRPSGAELIGGLICSAILVIGLCTRVTVPGHAALKAESTHAFFIALSKGLAWPLVNQPWLTVLMQMPLVLLCYQYLSTTHELQDDRRKRCAELLLATGFWVWLQTGAIAYVRGGHGYGPVSRYQDLLAIGGLVNFLSLALLLSRPTLHAPRFRPRHLLSLVWIFCLGWGLVQLTTQNFAFDIFGRSRSLLAEEENVRAYLATGDFDRYLAHKLMFDIPYPDSLVLQSYLDDKTLRRILPANVRQPIAVEPPASPTPEDAFVANGFPAGWEAPPIQPVWGSFTTAGKPSKGTWTGRLLEPVSLPYLKFCVAGELGAKGLSLGVRKVSGKQSRFPRPNLASSGVVPWRSISLPRPSDGALEIIATDNNRGRWFAFTAPTEMGRWSHWTQRLLACSGSIFVSGLCSLSALGLLYGMTLRNSEKSSLEVAP